jgi:hypothetical protein
MHYPGRMAVWHRTIETSDGESRTTEGYHDSVKLGISQKLHTILPRGVICDYLCAYSIALHSDILVARHEPAG